MVRRAKRHCAPCCLASARRPGVVRRRTPPAPTGRRLHDRRARPAPPAPRRTRTPQRLSGSAPTPAHSAAYIPATGRARDTTGRALTSGNAARTFSDPQRDACARTCHTRRDTTRLTRRRPRRPQLGVAPRRKLARPHRHRRPHFRRRLLHQPRHRPRLARRDRARTPGSGGGPRTHRRRRILPHPLRRLGPDCHRRRYRHPLPGRLRCIRPVRP